MKKINNYFKTTHKKKKTINIRSILIMFSLVFIVFAIVILHINCACSDYFVESDCLLRVEEASQNVNQCECEWITTVNIDASSKNTPTSTTTMSSGFPITTAVLEIEATSTNVGEM